MNQPALAGQAANLSRLSVSCSGGFVPGAAKDSLSGWACHLARQAVARETSGSAPGYESGLVAKFKVMTFFPLQQLTSIRIPLA